MKKITWYGLTCIDTKVIFNNYRYTITKNVNRRSRVIYEVPNQ